MARTKFCLAAVVLAAAAAGLRCGGDGGTAPGKIQLSISPDSAVVEISASQPFQLASTGRVPDVVWLVEDSFGGSVSEGVIDTTGTYIAPAAAPADSVVTITARALSDPGMRATARVLIRGGAGVPYVRAVPGDTSLAPGEAIVFAKEVVGCPGVDVVWSVEPLSAGAGDAGSMGTDGSYTVPGTIAGDIRLLVRAASQTCADRTGIAIVTVTRPLEFEVELEDYTDWHDDENGSSYMATAYCSKASGNRMVRGLDYPGEWIEVPFDVPVYGTYELELRYATLRGDTLRVTVTFEGCGPGFPGAEVGFVLDRGEGLG